MEEARRELARRGIPGHPSAPKNWDLLRVLAELRDGNLLDMGCAGCPVLEIAHRLGLRGEKVGIDLIPVKSKRPGIVLMQGDLTDTGLPDAHFDLITCLSVIEHGVSFPRFGREVRRLLRTGGTAIVTFDYWDNPKPPVFSLFDLEWIILNRDAVNRFIAIMAGNGLALVEPVDWTTSEAPLKASDYSPSASGTYTFGCLQFRIA